MKNIYLKLEIDIWCYKTGIPDPTSPVNVKIAFHCILSFFSGKIQEVTTQVTTHFESVPFSLNSAKDNK